MIKKRVTERISRGEGGKCWIEAEPINASLLFTIGVSLMRKVVRDD